MSEPLHVYCHVPFCQSRCPYCDFTTYAGEDHQMDAYTDALLAEIEGRRVPNRHAQTIYIGGGTPTHLGSTRLAAILAAIEFAYPQACAGCEVTVEANPASASRTLLADLRSAGVNRISFGWQSLTPSVLRTLGRAHTADDAISAVASARDAGFSNISVDLMYAVPGQLASDWISDIRRTVDIRPTHVSLYGLSVEQGTPFERLVADGLTVLPTEELQIEQYYAAVDTLADAGYEHYEISNWAIPGFRAAHNSAYWANREYIGLGAGAASYLARVRSTNERGLTRYIDRAAQSGTATAEYESLAAPVAAAEELILALRMLDGADPTAVAERWNVDASQMVNRLEPWVDGGLLEREGDNYRLTRRGLILSDTVFVGLLPDDG